MYAATVTGSPVENACRLIKRYESRGRGYYGAALAVLGRDASGGPVVDSPIVTRIADVDLDGDLTVMAGATRRRDSDAAYEAAETHAKAGGTSAPSAWCRPGAGPRSQRRRACQRRGRATGSQRRQPPAVEVPGSPIRPARCPTRGCAAKHVVVLDGEDDFVTCCATSWANWA